DSYVLTSDFNVVPSPERVYPDILVDLDAVHYKFISDLDERFPFGPPSLVNARSFVLQGDFRFGKDVVCKGAVHLINESGHRKFIPDNSVLDGTIRYT
ncbi:MAG: UTP--glucose-1-phosphate uridylyltransferase, partial [Candidatus Promineifilaceae bacterium]